jgi:hypothetical protein
MDCYGTNPDGGENHSTYRFIVKLVKVVKVVEIVEAVMS